MVVAAVSYGIHEHRQRWRVERELIEARALIAEKSIQIDNQRQTILTERADMLRLSDLLLQIESGPEQPSTPMDLNLLTP